jgi:hypothetical protein
MRIWDLPVDKLCRNHLLGEHRELHALWSIIIEEKKGYSKHPETLRWKGKLNALYLRHEKQVAEMKRRGYKHNSPLDDKLATGDKIQDVFVDPVEKQKNLLKNKKCDCEI